MDFKNPVYARMREAQLRLWNADTDDEAELTKLQSDSLVAQHSFENLHGHVWVLFMAPADKKSWPNFSPVMISRDEQKLKRLAETLPGFHDKNGPVYQLFHLPTEVMLAGEYNGEFQGMLGNFEHHHLQEED